MADFTDGKSAQYSRDALDESREELAREAAMLFSIAENHLNEGAYKEAEKAAAEALKLFRELGDRTAVADTIRNLISICRAKGQIGMAEEMAKEELERFVEAEDRFGEASMLLALAELNTDMFEIGQTANVNQGMGLDETLRTGLEAQLLFQELGDKKMEACTLLALTAAYKEFQRGPEIMQAASDALSLFRELLDGRGEAKALLGVAFAHAQTENWQEALTYTKDALSLFQELAITPLEAACLFFSAQWSLMLKDYRAMLSDAEDCLELYRNLEDQKNEATAVGLVVNAHTLNEENDAALVAAEEALARFQEMGYKRGEAIAQDSLVTCHLADGQKDQAVTTAQNALELIRELGDTRWEATLELVLAKTQLDVGQAKAARKNVKAAIDILSAQGDAEAEAEARLQTLVHAYIDEGDFDGAFKAANEALELYRSLGNQNGMASAFYAGGAVFQQSGRFDEAEGWIKEAQKIFHELGDNKMLVHITYTLANISISKKAPEDGAKLAHEAHLLSMKVGEKPLEINILLFVVQANFAILTKLVDEGVSRESRSFMDALTKAEKAATAAIKITSTLEDMFLSANATYALAEVNMLNTKFKDVLEGADEAANMYRSCEHKLGEGTAVHLKAQTLHLLGRFQESLESAELALSIAQEEKDSQLEALAQTLISKMKMSNTGQGEMMLMQQQQQQVEETAAPVASAVVEEKPKGLDPLMVGDMLHGMLREMIGVQMESDTPFMDAGVDSLMSIEFRSQVNQAFSGLGLASTLTFDYPTIRELTSHIVDKSNTQ